MKKRGNGSNERRGRGRELYVAWKRLRFNKILMRRPGKRNVS